MNIDEPTDLPPGSRKPWRQMVEQLRNFERAIERITGNSSAGGAGSVYTQSEVDRMFRNLDERLAKLEPNVAPVKPYRPGKW